MKYFSNLPKIIKTDAKGNSIIMSNLLARASVIPSLMKNPAVFYQYDIQDGDTPEIIAHKYYGDSYRYWIVLFVNQIVDPQWDWPMNSTVFNNYIQDKYKEFNPYSQVHHYEKLVTKYDNNTQTTTVDKFVIDEINFLQICK